MNYILCVHVGCMMDYSAAAAATPTNSKRLDLTEEENRVLFFIYLYFFKDEEEADDFKLLACFAIRNLAMKRVQIQLTVVVRSWPCANVVPPPIYVWLEKLSGEPKLREYY